MASVFPNPALPEEREMPAIPTQGATGKYPLPFPSAMVWWQSLWRKYQRMGGGGIQQLWRQNFCPNFKIWFLLSFPRYPWSSIPAGGWFSHQNPCACKLSILSPSIWELSRKFPSRALYLNLGIGKSLCGHTHGFSLLQAPFPGLFGQILAADEKANGFWPVRGRLLPALVDGVSDGKGHAKGKRFQIPQGETLKLRREKNPQKVLSIPDKECFLLSKHNFIWACCCCSALTNTGHPKDQFFSQAGNRSAGFETAPGKLRRSQ